MSSPFQVTRQARARELVASSRRVSDARMYRGAADNDCPAFDFQTSYNNPDLIGRRGGRVSENYIRAMAEKKTTEAKDCFRKACVSCEFCKQGATTIWCGDKRFKESIFWDIFNDPKTRKRFYARIKSPLFAGGEKTLPCAIAIRPGRLKKSDWVE